MNISPGAEQTVHLIICSAMALIVIVLMRKEMKFLEPRSACQWELFLNSNTNTIKTEQNHKN